jgi:glycosyltransferase involved in cell wall biosynthesis
MAGTADTEETEARIRSFLDDHGLQEAVTLAGLVRGERKKALFRDNGVFVFPSRFENSPVTLKEATQAGMAIVASDIPSNLAILERTGNHVAFAVGSADALAAALMQVMDDEDLYLRLRDRARDGFKFDESYARQALAAFLD